jgi:hypothetical protein
MAMEQLQSIGVIGEAPVGERAADGFIGLLIGFGELFGLVVHLDIVERVFDDPEALQAPLRESNFFNDGMLITSRGAELLDTHIKHFLPSRRILILFDVIPCLIAFRDERALPSTVWGPPERLVCMVVFLSDV